MIYRIKDWDSRFENKDSRKIIKARWVPVPNKHDGLGFRRIANHKRSCEVFAAWNLLLQVASRMPRRGVLHNGETALSAEDLALMTGFPQAAFDVAFEVLIDPKIGWIETEGIPQNAPSSGESPGESGANSETSRQGGSEGKGMEGNGIEEGKGETSSPQKQKRFSKPTLEELEKAFEDRGLSKSDATTEGEKFLDHFEANGWRIGKALAPMKSWQHAVNTWTRNRKQWDTNGHAANNSTNGFSRNSGTCNDKPEVFDRIKAHEERIRNQGLSGKGASV